MSYIDNFSLKEILYYILIGIVIYLICYVIDRLIILFLPKKIVRVKKTWDKIKIFIWGLFFTKGIFALWSFNLLWMTGLLGLTLALGWPLWRNLFAGLWFKMTNILTPGQTLNFKDFNGEVCQITWMNTYFRDNNKHELTIPNNILLKKLLTQIHPSSNINTTTFIWKSTSNYSTEDIYAALNMSPFIVSNSFKDVTINDNFEFTYRISVVLIDASFESKLIHYLNDYFQKQAKIQQTNTTK